ncbi:uncharacterized protein [Physcomitrium patens]|uniref:uncharacterized protein n=1 Tax=Physcomitrium patens TaxID=3218 RepID=UPI003CCC9698
MGSISRQTCWKDNLLNGHSGERPRSACNSMLGCSSLSIAKRCAVWCAYGLSATSDSVWVHRGNFISFQTLSFSEQQWPSEGQASLTFLSGRPPCLLEGLRWRKVHNACGGHQ